MELHPGSAIFGLIAGFALATFLAFPIIRYFMVLEEKDEEGENR